MTIRTVTNQFGDFDNLEAFREIEGELAPYDFIDLSWGNDVCPSIAMLDPQGEDVVVRIWVDYKNPDLREFGNSAPQFLMCVDCNNDSERGHTATDDVNTIILAAINYTSTGV